MTPGPGTRVLVWGFGRHGGGQAAARFCAALGATVEILELKPATAFGSAGASAIAAGWTWHVGNGAHPALAAADLVVASPAIPPREWPTGPPPRTAPEGLFFSAHRGSRIAVTGTKGKSTTAHMVASLLGWKVAGNSFEPLLDLLAQYGPEVPVVCELSSFQLWYLGLNPTPPRFAATVFTSLAIDHLDWHPHVEHYQAAKLAALQWSPVVVVAPDVLPCIGGKMTHVAPVWFQSKSFYDAEGVIAQRSDLALLGSHNARNAALAIAVARHLGLPREAVSGGLRAIDGLPHRLEEVPSHDGRRYLNDSIATTPESAMAAMEAVEGKMAIILGGSDKGVDFSRLATAIATRQAIPILIGATALRMGSCLSAIGIVYIPAGTLAAAVSAAQSQVPRGGAIVLSPACASFDQFMGFEDRGEQFRALVAQAPRV